ncbi:4Fe-4S dicluster domain-containing protein [Fibrobacterota bacterium]
MKKIIVVDVEKCMSCHSCELHCAVAHSQSKNLEEAMLESPSPVNRVILQQFGEMTMPLHCRHCEDAPCMAVCPTKAISRLSVDDPVIVDNDKCIGCHECILICPFGVMRKGKNERVMIKCDLCHERLAEGKNPACVEGCPTGAIKYAAPDEAAALKRKKYMVQIQKGEA